MKQATRIIDIARAANVSIGTVDRVLHNRGRVAAKTREKVLKIAEDLGYEPNVFATALASKRKATSFACFLPARNQDPFWDAVHLGIDQAIEYTSHVNIRCHVVYFDLFDAKDFVNKFEQIDLDVDACLLAPVFFNEGKMLVRTLEAHHIKYALINTLLESNESSFLTYVGPDSYQSGRLAARLLSMHLGPGDQVLMIPLEKNFRNAYHMVLKEKGFRDCIGKTASEVEVFTCEIEEFEDEDAVARVLGEQIRRFPRLKAIYSSASRIHHIAKYFGDRNEHAVKIVGYDSLDQNIHYLNLGYIDYLINQNPMLMGYKGLNSLIKYFTLKTDLPKLQYMPLDIMVPENIEYYAGRDLNLEDVISR